MRRPTLFATLAIAITATGFAIAGTLELTTYYPSPTGNFTTITTNSLGIGTTSPETGSVLQILGGDLLLGKFLGVTSTNQYGPAIRFGGQSGHNTDQITLRQYTVSPNITELQLSLGDDAVIPGAADKFVIGAIDNSTFTYAPRFSFNSLGNLQIDGTTAATNAVDPKISIRDSRGGGVWNYVDFFTGGVRRGVVGADTRNNMALVGDTNISIYAGGAERVLVQQDGNVGIGNTTPLAPVSISTDLNLYGGGAGILAFNNYWTATGWRYQNSNRGASLIYQPSAAGEGGLAFLTSAPGGGGSLVPSWNLPLYLTKEGHVGINNWSPSAKLDVVGAGGVSVDFKLNGRMQIYDPGSPGAAGIWFGTAYPTPNSNFWGQVNTSEIGYWFNDRFWFRVDSQGRIGTHALAPTQNFPAGWQGGLSTHDVYGAGGTIGIGPGGGVYTAYLQHQAGDLGYVFADAYFYRSDKRLKENILPITHALDTVSKLQGVTFQWKSSKKKSIGFVAQDVEKVLPDLVTEAQNGYKSVEYPNLVSLLVEAIKEQQKEISDLRTRIERLEKRNSLE